MTFTSFPFVVFFPVVILIFYLLPSRFRWVFLLVASAFFYWVFSWQCLMLLLGMSLLNYFIGIRILNKDGHIRKHIYVSGILLNILCLVFFKYFNSFGPHLRLIADSLHLYYPDSVLNIIFPLGISFFVFTAISYLIDIKKKVIQPEKNPGILVTYFLFFPKLIQGPIERAGNVIPQLKGNPKFSYEDVSSGLKLMAWGFFKKLVIADRLAVVVNGVYADPGKYNGLTLVTATIFFAFQVYADFSGYTDIAVGASRILGIRIMQNFHAPYLSVSIKDFWNRWHISLSQWLRDYLFLPVSYAVSRRMKNDRYLGVKTELWIYLQAAFVTFLICGIWHGVGWNYIVWGMLFALYLSFAQFTIRQRKRINKSIGLAGKPRLLKFIQIITTFSLVTFAWIFFRAGNLQEAFLVIGNSFQGWSVQGLTDSVQVISGFGLTFNEFLIAVVSVSLLMFADRLSKKTPIEIYILHRPVLLRWLLYYAILVVIILYGVFEKRPFIYQQF
jgi:D-alanyl-lipoteichoic acid acyltransferase DltB (MBOAT superfamily)